MIPSEQITNRVDEIMNAGEESIYKAQFQAILELLDQKFNDQ